MPPQAPAAETSGDAERMRAQAEERTRLDIELPPSRAGADMQLAIRRQDERLPFAQRITAAELLEALEVQRALSRQGVDVVEAVRAAEAGAVDEDDRHAGPNVTSLDMAAKTPRKGPPA